MKILNTLLLACLALTIPAVGLSQVSYNFNEFGTAIHHNDIATIKSMLANGTSPNEMQNVTTPLGIATDRNYDEAFDILMEQPGIEINTVFTIEYLGAGYENARIKNALLCAVDSRNIRMANILLDRGAIADFQYSDKHTDGTAEVGTTLMNSFRIPISDDALALSQRIADNTINLNRTFTYLHTPEVNLLYKLLVEVDCKDYNSVVKSIIDRGANCKGYFEPDASGLAVMKQYATAAEYAALEKNLQYTYTSCPIAAAQNGNSELLDYMLTKGASTERYADKGAILMLSCTTAECVEVLIKHGVDVNVTHPISGWPLLFTAAGLPNDLLEGILKLGADPNIEANGLKALDVIRGASSKQRKASTKVLEKYGYK